MNTPNTNQNETARVTVVTDDDLLNYLIKECGKTKDEWINEITERFWFNGDLTNYLNKPS